MGTQRTQVTQQDAMALAYYGYPDSRKLKEEYDAEKEQENSTLDNQKERPTFNMPEDWDFIKASDLEKLGLAKDFNVYRSDKKEVSNYVWAFN